MTKVSCKERKAKPGRVHEVARFNQTFYPYACVLFSADCAVRRDMRYAATAALGPAATGWRWTCVVGCAVGVIDADSLVCDERSRSFFDRAMVHLHSRRETALAYHGCSPATEKPA
ncbi:hypothetical protein C7T79_04190 [Xanthomonas oryzae pv. oryzicola]|nr:hypothetical protein C7T79_04190 [Xanthomonas oryzae pv. oryzicola]